jgi:Pentapeptide repeats (8 copies)
VNLQKLFRWRPTRRQLLWAEVIAALALLIIVICGYFFGWPWTGLTSSKVPPNTQPTKTLWDWLDLLIVPIVLAIGGYLFNSSQNRATEAAAERRAQDEALQAYLDHMSDMLTPSRDQPSLYEESSPERLRVVARARTLTVLPRLDGDRKASVVQFLYESGLIAGAQPIVDLSRADLSGTNLCRARLFQANLSYANLRGADLSRVANLREANLNYADLSGADLSMMSDLSDASLIGADLSRANLSHANLAGATITEPPPRGDDG